MKQILLMLSLACCAVNVSAAGDKECIPGGWTIEKIAPELMEGLAVRFNNTRFFIPGGLREVITSEGMTMFLFPERRVISVQMTSNAGIEGRSAANVYRQVYGLLPLDDSDDVEAIMNLRRVSCPKEEKIRYLSLPTGQEVVLSRRNVDKDEWYAALIFPQQDGAVTLVNFRGFSERQVEKILATSVEALKAQP